MCCRGYGSYPPYGMMHYGPPPGSGLRPMMPLTSVSVPPMMPFPRMPPRPFPGVHRQACMCQCLQSYSQASPALSQACNPGLIKADHQCMACRALAGAMVPMTAPLFPIGTAATDDATRPAISASVPAAGSLGQVPVGASDAPGEPKWHLPSRNTPAWQRHAPRPCDIAWPPVPVLQEGAGRRANT